MNAREAKPGLVLIEAIVRRVRIGPRDDQLTERFPPEEILLSADHPLLDRGIPDRLILREKDFGPFYYQKAVAPHSQFPDMHRYYLREKP